MTDVAWTIYQNGAEMAAGVAEDMRLRVQSALDKRGRTLIALPGGTTPAPIFERLAPSISAWQKVTILPTDDRLVFTESPLSNAAMIQRWFASRGARVVPLADASYDAEMAGRLAAARLQELDWPPDVVWLGMGADGHTASLFAGPDLANALQTSDLATGLRPDPLPPEAPVHRVTLSLSALTSALSLMVVISGGAKRAVMERALMEGAKSALPIGRVLAAAQGPVTVHWSP